MIIVELLLESFEVPRRRVLLLVLLHLHLLVLTRVHQQELQRGLLLPLRGGSAPRALRKRVLQLRRDLA